MAEPTVRTRIAPSPTGDWHLGNARTALFSYLFTRQQGGQFYLRIEDTDRTRFVEGSIERLLGVLQWLGMEPDPLPNGKPYLVQSENLSRYREVIDELLEKGQAYYCFAAPEELATMRLEQESAKQPPRYDNRWGYRDLPLEEAKKRVDAGESYVIRQKMPISGQTIVEDLIRGEIVYDNALLDDHILLKSDGFPTYHLAHVVDDHDMAITHVIRGEEWLPSSPRHVQLYGSLGWDRPILVHAPVILGPDKGKLSKRHGAKPIFEYRESGYLANGLINFLAFLGWSTGDDQELFSRDELIKRFTLERIHDHPAIFDSQKLDWFNASHIRTLSPEALHSQLLDFLDPEWKQRLEAAPVFFDRVVIVLQDRLTTLADFPVHADIFYTAPQELEATQFKIAPQLLQEVISRLDQVSDWNHETLETLLRQIAEEKGVKAGDLLWTVRYGLTGQKASPGAFEMLTVLGKEKSLERLQTALSLVSEG